MHGTSVERGKPIMLLHEQESLSQERLMVWSAEDEGGSERPPVMGGIEGEIFPHAKASRLPSGLSARERLTNRLRR